MDLVDTNAGVQSARRPRRSRRAHSAQFKAEVVRECTVPGVSLASIAMARGVNANLVRRWCVAHQRSQSLAPIGAKSAALLAVTVQELTAAPTAPPKAPLSRRSDAIAIEVFGARVSVRVGFDDATLRSVIAILRESRAR